MERFLTEEELEEFAVEEDLVMAQRHIKLTAEILDYDAERLLNIISVFLKKTIKKGTLNKIARAIIKNIPSEAPEAVLRWLLSHNIIKKCLLSRLNKQVLKKWSLKIREANIKRNENDVLLLLAEVEVLSFSDLLIAIKKEISKKDNFKYKDIVENGLEAFNSEVEEDAKASFVYKILGSTEFGNILNEVQTELLLLIQDLLQDNCKLQVKLKKLYLGVAEKNI